MPKHIEITIFQHLLKNFLCVMEKFGAEKMAQQARCTVSLQCFEFVAKVELPATVEHQVLKTFVRDLARQFVFPDRKLEVTEVILQRQQKFLGPKEAPIELTESDLFQVTHYLYKHNKAILLTEINYQQKCETCGKDPAGIYFTSYCHSKFYCSEHFFGQDTVNHLCIYCSGHKNLQVIKNKRQDKVYHYSIVCQSCLNKQLSTFVAKICDGCGAPIKIPQYCARCKQTCYCDMVCQKRHWKWHKDTCK